MGAIARPDRGHRARLVLLGIVALFALPVIAAWLLAHPGRGWGGATVNRGELLEPLELSAAGLAPLDGASLGPGALRGRWSLVYLSRAACAAPCERALYALRQVQRALGRNLERVQRLLVIEPGVPPAAALAAVAERYPGTRVAAASPAWRARLAGEAASSAIYLLDPRGFRVLRYRDDADPRDILRDLERLLKAEGG